MMPDMYEGLFGPTPEQIQQAQQMALQQRGDQLARMSPFERANAQIYSGAGGLMSAIGDKIGLVNPQVQQARDAQAIQKTIDHSTSAGLLEGAAKLKEVNPALALKYVQAAQAMKEKEAAINLKNAQAQKALRDPSFRDYEYEKMMEIVNDPDSTPEMIAQAKARLEALNAKGRGAAGGTGRAIKIDTANGSYWADPYTKKVYTLSGQEVDADTANKILAASNDPVLQANLAQVKAGAKTVGTAAGTAQSKIPEVQAAMDTATKQVEELLAHPGFKEAVGMGLPGAKYITGGKVKDFTNRLEQIKGGAFLQAFNTLRGGGQITEVEGAKATAAINRMDAATSEEEFRAAAKDFLDNVRVGLEKLQKIGRLSYQAPTAVPVAPTPSVPSAYNGSKSNATAEQIRILESEYNNPLYVNDKPSILREINRLKAEMGAQPTNTPRRVKFGELQ